MVMMLVLALAQDARDALIKKQIADAVALLEKESAAEYRVGQTTLRELGRAAEPELVKALAHAKPQVRALACDVLGEIRAGSKESIAALIDRLKDDDYFGASVSAHAARALGAIGDAAAIPALTEALEVSKGRPDASLRYESVSALGKLRALTAIDAIRPLVTDKGKTDADQLVASAALAALVTLEARGAVEEIAAALDNVEIDEWGPYPDWQIGQLAAWALERLIDPKDWPTPNKSVVDADTAGRTTLNNGWKGWRDNRKKTVETRATLTAIVAAIDKFKADHKNDLPRDLKELAADKKYVDSEDRLKDAWARWFVFVQPGWGAEYNLTSLGSDGLPGGRGDAADIWNHEAWREITLTKTKETLKAVKSAIGVYKSKHANADPPTLAALTEELKEEAKDAWGNALSYIPGSAGSPMVLKSLGYDAREGGEGIDADIDAPKDVP
jgi:HEAT repeat protein